MPEQLLGRIIRACSNPADVVLDDEQILPADVVAVIDAENDATAAAEEQLAIAESAANTAPLFDEDPAEDAPSPTPAPAEEPVGKGDGGAASGDGEAAS